MGRVFYVMPDPRGTEGNWTLHYIRICGWRMAFRGGGCE